MIDKTFLEKYIGKSLEAVTEEFILLGYSYRVCVPNGLLTADFKPDRIDVLVDENKIVTGFDIG